MQPGKMHRVDEVKSMIEMVYKEKEKEEKTGCRLNLPKNIRQIGEPEENRKIYIEDYVITYLRRYAKEQVLNSRAAILLGNSERMDGIPYLFIKSAIALKELEVKEGGIPFTDEIWAEIYSTVKEYFEGQDILGWFLSAPGYPLDLEEGLLKTHVNFFGGVDKVLLIEEPVEGEENFFAYDNGKMSRQRGYYIFYEKNEAMQRYMIETGDGESVDEKEEFEDRAMKSFRAIVQEKKEMSGQKRVMTFLYTASTFLVMVVLVIGITLLNNYEKMEGLEMTLNEISQSLEKQESQAAEALSAENEIKNEAEIAESVIPEQEGSEKENASGQDTEETEKLQEAAGQEVRSIPESYVVQKGDTLLKISRKIYGNDDMLEKICRLNNIEDSDRILAGQKLLLPE